jgi:GT2 family glycosyltransferase
MISIIVVTYNNPEDLNRLYKSLKTYECDSNYEFIVVDNSSDELIWQAVNNYENVIYRKSDNKGFGYSNNVGASIANGEFLFFLNPDTFFVRPILDEIYYLIKTNYPKFKSFFLQQLDIDLRKRITFFTYDSSGFIDSLAIKIFNSISLFSSRFHYPSAAAIIVEKKTFKDIDGFDSSLFLYYEEPDIYKRMKMNHIKTKFLKKIEIVHEVGTSTGDLSWKTGVRLNSLLIYSNKWGLNYIRLLYKIYNYNKLKLFVYKGLRNRLKIEELTLINDIIMVKLR